MNQRTFWLVQIALWTSFALLTRFTWIDVRPPTWLWISTYMVMGLMFSSLLALCYDQLQKKSRFTQLLLSIVLSVALGLAWRAGFNAIEYNILESANNQFKFWGYFHNAKSAVMQLLIWSGGYWLIRYHRILNQQRMIQQQLALEAKEANLKMLQYQITPHFLFNVLSGLDTLMLKGDANAARQMLQKLSDYLRHTLNKAPGATQSLDDEIAQCRRYLEIEQLRFKDKITLDWQVSSDATEYQVPGGVLLPLFENALKHGAISTGESTLITTNLKQENNKIYLKISNNLSQQLQQSEGFGIGLNNTQQRLSRFFGDKVRFTTSHNTQQFQVNIEFTL